jgi:hypothetical protein
MLDQHPENQAEELRRYAAARGWQAVEFIDKGVSGARESRPASLTHRHPLELTMLRDSPVCCIRLLGAMRGPTSRGGVRIVKFRHCSLILNLDVAAPEQPALR